MAQFDILYEEFQRIRDLLKNAKKSQIPQLESQLKAIISRIDLLGSMRDQVLMVAVIDCQKKSDTVGTSIIKKDCSLVFGGFQYENDPSVVAYIKWKLKRAGYELLAIKSIKRVPINILNIDHNK